MILIFLFQNLASSAYTLQIPWNGAGVSWLHCYQEVQNGVLLYQWTYYSVR